jgi:hypothetical protein
MVKEKTTLFVKLRLVQPTFWSLQGEEEWEIHPRVDERRTLPAGGSGGGCPVFIRASKGCGDVIKEADVSHFAAPAGVGFAVEMEFGSGVGKDGRPVGFTI